jgi:lambda family phage portal protein
VDRAIGAAFPGWGLRRHQARMRLEAASGLGRVPARGGQKTGTLHNWAVNRLSRLGEALERENVTDRAEDLAANDPHAASCIDSMSVNVVGTGLTPQSRPRYQLLGITEDEAREIADQAEWIFRKWCAVADASRLGHFQDLTFLNIYQMLRNGEYVNIPLMRSRPDPDSGLALCLQPVSSLRLRTPTDLAGDPRIRDGIRLGELGEPVRYHIADPPETLGGITLALSSEHFSTYPARIGHRPGILHGFYRRETDQVRGQSILAPAMKFFKDLSDYLDFELVGNIVASSFPLWIERQAAWDGIEGLPAHDPQNQDTTRYQELEPGSIYYGNAGEKPHPLKSERPSNTFEGFVQTILKAVSASAGLPYEVVSKDFSKTNYSSARAALLEAWRVYQLYRQWLVRRFCQPVWEMVFEEAWLRGLIRLPAGGPDFYAARKEYTYATWIGPPKGHVDPVKEIEANIQGLEKNIFTLADLVAEQGGDWETTLEQRSRERQMERAQDVEPEPDGGSRRTAGRGTRDREEED